MMRFVILLCLATAVLGISTQVGRQISGAIPARIEDYPYQLSLELNGSPICEASIISEIWALTVAHCTAGRSKHSLKLRAGSSYRETGGRVYDIEKISTHRLYDSNTMVYDIALIKVATPFVFGAGVTAIALPLQGDDVETGTIATATGWGLLTSSTSEPRQLNALAVPVLGPFECQRAYPDREIAPTMLCAGYSEKGKRCQGNPGAPLVYDNKLIGMAHGCANRNQPGIYTRVSRLRNWIVQGGTSGAVSLSKISITLQLIMICFQLLFK